MRLSKDQILEIWQEARGSALREERREEFLARTELHDLSDYSAAELRQGFTRTGLLSEALVWLRERDQIAAHGRAPTQPAASQAEKSQLAASMRRAPTAAEHQLWLRLRHGVLGHAVVSQLEIDGWIADFAVPDVELVIEVDGSAHDTRSTADRRRDDHMRANHFEVLRFTNTDVERDLDSVMEAITNAVRKRLATTDIRREAAADLQLVADVEKLRAARNALREERPRERLARHARQAPTPQPNPKIRYRCETCEHEFVASLSPQPQCRNDRAHVIRRMCRETRCETWIPLGAERCQRCEDAREVARTSAGAGAQSPSQLKQARKGKRWSG